MRLLSCATVLLLLSAGQPVHAQRAAGPLADLDRYVEKALADWKVPGISIAVVRNDSVILARGYGLRRIDDSARVDAETIFAIGSNSKAFTTAAMAMLVDEKKLAWSEPVTRYLPWFQLSDPWITRNLDLRDLVSHRSGVARHDALWYGTGLSPEELVRRQRFVGTERPFRASWVYNNNLYITAGLAIQQVSGMSWDDFVTERILQPLAMSRSTTTVRGLESTANVAAPHMELDGAIRAVPYRNIDNAAPAGSINASARDMAQWLRFQIDSGRIGAKRLLPASQLAETWRGIAVIQDPYFRQLFAPSPVLEYGLGWFSFVHRDQRVVLHGGNIDGMSALVSFIPEQRIGIVALANMNQSFVHLGITRWIYDRLLGAPGEDWNTKVLAALKAASSGGAAAAERWKSERVPGTTQSLALEKYAGRYADSLYGSIEIKTGPSGLLLDMDPGHQARLRHWHYDTFRAEYHDATMNGSSNFVSFRLDAQGVVQAVRVQGFTEYVRATR